MRTIRPADVEERARLREIAERPLPLDEWQRLAAMPISDDERERTLELIRWFRRRYPSPRERLAYVRRAYKRWAAQSDPGKKSELSG